MNKISWDDLRRQARAIENELDTKLSSYGALARATGTNSNVHTELRTQTPHFVASGLIERNSNLDRDDPSQSYSRMTTDIEGLLQRLTTINDQMSDLVHELDMNAQSALLEAHSSIRTPLLTNPGSTVGTSGTPASEMSVPMTAGQMSQLHTAKRHRDILRDYAQEFRQTNTKIAAAREREDLLGSVYRDTANRDGTSPSSPSSSSSTSTHTTVAMGNHRASGQSNATRILLDEQDKYHRSNRMMDDHLTAASAIRSTLRAQRLALRNASTSLHQLSTRFPRVRQLIGKIDWRHRKDSIVLGVVIACCLAFLIIYKLT